MTSIGNEHKQGFRVMYRGLDSAILRQLVYASARLGLYNFGINWANKSDRKVNKLEKVGLSMISGLFGALVGTPFDIALIRRQSSITTGKKNYKNTFDAFRTIIN